MNIQEELGKLELMMSEGLNSENMAQIERIKEMATTPEDNAAIDEFVARHLIDIENDVEENGRNDLSLTDG